VVASVENPAESEPTGPTCGADALQVQLLGPLTIRCNGVELTLPSSRKVRALLAYLALAPQALSRSRLCELLWDVPNDPRGELRWSLSKLRSIVDTPGRQRVETRDDYVRLDLADCAVDAADIASAIQPGIETLSAARLQDLGALFKGEFLEGLEIDRHPAFNGWLTAQRRRFRGCRVAVLEHLARNATSATVSGYLEAWRELAPFDPRVHELLLDEFARRGQIREGEQHLAATVRLFEAEGLDCRPVREAWRNARAGAIASSGTGGVGSGLVVASTAIRDGPDSVVTRHGSIAVMPFIDYGSPAAARGSLAGGLVHDVITRLSKLRSLRVIAQGTVFALSERQVGAEEAGRMLNVDYVVSGSVQREGNRLRVGVELTETRTARVAWAESFNQKVDDAFSVLDEIGNRIVASIASEIELVERNRAILKPPNSLDAWEAHHRGLWHMYRFNQGDNERARHFFATAVRLDPTFSRAYAGLSFTHFQNAFQRWTERGPEVAQAIEMAGQGLIVDDRDPAAHWAMGRALWLRGRQEESVVELQNAIELSPNFALGHYALAFVHSQGGDAQAAIGFSDHSRQLSPFDPLLFGMLGARAMALVRLKQFEEAADWGIRAAARPNAHAHIRAIAAYALALADRLGEARAQIAEIHKRLPAYRVDDFLATMQFAPEGAALFREGAKRIV
jgi:DNA-binding SARP family transcriptional activator/TolB-like protein